MAIQFFDERDRWQGHPINLETIERLRRLRKQIWEENNREFFEDSAELIHQMREERTQHLMELFTRDKTDGKTNNQ